jgi:hypothetical protein
MLKLTPLFITRENMRFEVNEHGCWIFQGSLDKDGYGKFKLKNVDFRAHRVMAQLTIKSYLAESDVIGHKCDNPSCINPKHLFVTTALGNMQDRDKKMRGSFGEKCQLSKLTADQVREIRLRYQAGESMGKISQDYPVTYGAVQAIIRGRTWKNLT